MTALNFLSGDEGICCAGACCECVLPANRAGGRRCFPRRVAGVSIGSLPQWPRICRRCGSRFRRWRWYDGRDCRRRFVFQLQRAAGRRNVCRRRCGRGPLRVPSVRDRVLSGRASLAFGLLVFGLRFGLLAFGRRLRLARAEQERDPPRRIDDAHLLRRRRGALQTRSPDPVSAITRSPRTPAAIASPPCPGQSP